MRLFVGLLCIFKVILWVFIVMLDWSYLVIWGLFGEFVVIWVLCYYFTLFN